MEHHAYCYVGIEGARKSLSDLLAINDPDIHVGDYDAFGISEARILRERASSLPVAAPVQKFIIVTHGVTHEAQNALLKLFEEPPARTMFYLAVPKRGLLLPTLQSRLFFMEEGGEDNEGNDTFASFEALSYGERLSQVAEIAKSKDIGTAEELIEGAEELAHTTGNKALLHTVMQVRSHFGVRGASTKMLLESLALALP